jgi:hypothetical protein
MYACLYNFIICHLNRMGLRPSSDFRSRPAGRYKSRSGQSHKEADSNLRPNDGVEWPSLVIETGWSESDARLRADGRWWLANPHTQLILLISYQRSLRILQIQKYEREEIDIVVTRTSPDGRRLVPVCTGTVNIDLSSSSPTIISGAPFILPFEALMRRRPAEGTEERDVELSHQNCIAWAESFAEALGQ